jgi:DNA primase
VNAAGACGALVDKGLIPEDVIQRIRERADILEVVGAHLTLSKAGQNFKGLCPFHSEKTPSFTVSPSRQMFHCFGCQEGGNVFTFLMKMDGATFPEAVRTLGQRYGIEVDERTSSPAARQRSEARERLFTLNRQAAEFFQRTLLSDPPAQPARDYLQKRGMRPDTIERFGLGYAPTGWDATLKTLTKAGAQTEDLAAGGLIVAREQGSRLGGEATGYYDRFRSRVMFPIRDLQKRVIGFGGRIIDDGQPKYLNSPETPLFSKSRTLYGFDSARDGISQSQQIVIVEGYFDVIALHQAGVTNAVATLGTALTADHVELIRRFTNHVVLVFDPDAAGVRAALRTMDLFLGSGLTVQVVGLPAGDDPDTFIRREGLDSFMGLLQTAPSLLEFTVEGSLSTGRQGSVEERVHAVEEVLALLQKLSNAVEKAASIRTVADRLGLDEKVLLERYEVLARQRTRVQKGSDSVQVAIQPAALPKDEEVLLQLLLHEKLSPDMLGRLAADDFTDSRARRLVSLAQSAAEQGHAIFPQILEQTESDEQSEALARSLSLRELPYDDVGAAFVQSFIALKLRRLADEIQELKAAQSSAEKAGQAETFRTLLMRLHALQQERQRLLKGDCLPLNQAAGRVHG